VGDIFIQHQLIGLEKEEDYNDKENINDPVYTPISRSNRVYYIK
jgi:hypothetical protein